MACLFVPHPAKLRSDLILGDHPESMPGVVRRVPRDVLEGGERDRGMTVVAGPVTDVREELGPVAATTVTRIDAELLEMSVAVDQ